MVKRERKKDEIDLCDVSLGSNLKENVTPMQSGIQEFVSLSIPFPNDPNCNNA